MDKRKLVLALTGVFFIVALFSICNFNGSTYSRARLPVKGPKIVKAEIFDGINSPWGECLTVVQSELGIMQLPGGGYGRHKGTRLAGKPKDKTLAGFSINRCIASFADDKLYSLTLIVGDEFKLNPPRYSVLKNEAKWREAKAQYDLQRKSYEASNNARNDKIIAALNKAYGEPISIQKLKSTGQRNYKWQDGNSRLLLVCRGVTELYIESLAAIREQKEELQREKMKRTPIKFVGSENKKILLAKGTFLDGLEFNCDEKKIKELFPDAYKEENCFIIDRPGVNFLGLKVARVSLDMHHDLLGPITLYGTNGMDAQTARAMVKGLLAKLEERLGKPDYDNKMLNNNDEIRGAYFWNKDENRIILDCFTASYDCPPSEVRYNIYISIANGYRNNGNHG